MTLRPHDSIAVAAILFFLALSLGCESLHRDIEKQLPPDDAGTVDDTGSPEKDVGEDTGQDVGEDTGHDDCEPGLSCGPCDEGETICHEGQQLCQGAVDLDEDDDHCGACNTPCETTVSGAEAFCQSGECTVECALAQQTICDDVDACVDLDSNLDHCGGCNQPCQTSEPDAEAFCDAGECTVECDLLEKSYCDEVDACVDLDSDVDHCGGCDQACASSGNEELVKCEQGECVCAEGAERCGDECVDLQSDDNHCGVCHNSCPGPHDCIDGQCQSL